MNKMEFIDTAEDRELIQTFFDATPEDVMKLIEQIVVSLLKQVTQEEEPSLDVVARSNKNAVFCKREQQLRLRLGTVKRRLSDGKRFQGLVKILQICYALGKERKTVNQRELYYMNTDVSSLSHTHFSDLFFTARVRRLYPGLHRPSPRPPRCAWDFSDIQGICHRKVWDSFFLKSRLFYCPKEEGVWYDMTMEKPHSITYDMINSLEVKSDAQFILVVEKVALSPIPHP